MRGCQLLTSKATETANPLQRWRDYAAATGYSGAQEVRAITSGLNDHRPKRGKLLTDPTPALGRSL